MRTSQEQSSCQRCRRKDPLEIVQYDQDLPVLQGPQQRLGLVFEPRRVDRQGRDELRDDCALGIRCCRQFDEEGPVRETVADAARGSIGKPGLTDTADADRGDQPMPLQQFHQLGDFPLPPDEGCGKAERLPLHAPRGFFWRLAGIKKLEDALTA